MSSPAPVVDITRQTEEPTTLVIKPIPASLLNKGDNMIASALGITSIDSDEAYTEAVELGTHIKGVHKDLEDARTTDVKPLNDAVKAINATYKASQAKCDDATDSLKKQLLAYQAKKREEQQAEEARLRKIQEDEQAKLRAAAAKREAAEQERARLAREKAEAAAKKLADEGHAERAKAAREVAEKAEADRLERARLEAEEKQAAADMMPAAVVSNTAVAPAAKGAANKKVWKYRIVDVALIPDEYKNVDEPMIARVVKAMKGKTNIPGVEAYEEDAIALTASR